MAKEVIVPPLGQTVDVVTLVSWFKEEGEKVEEGEPLFSIETDKATLDVEAPSSGVLRNVTVSEGDEVEALSVVALVAGEDEELSDQEIEPEQEEPTPEEYFSAPSPPSTLGPTLAPTPVSPPLADSSPTGVAPAPLPRERTFVSPRARRLAEEKGVALENLAGTGPEGAIVERDILNHLEKHVGAGLVPDQTITAPSAGLFNEVLAEAPLKGIRAITAQRMAESTSTAARVTLTAEVDAGSLVTLRKELIQDDVPVSYNDLLLYILGRVLREQPEVNASLDGEVLHRWKRVHIGLAIDTDRGLLVPVLRDVDTKGLNQLAQESADLIARARNGKLKPDELQGGTFTLTNLGMFGIDAFTPIINLPETAILGVGRIKPRPVVEDGEIVARETAWLSLAFDHRLVDGAPAARFLQQVVRLIEHPHLMYA